MDDLDLVDDDSNSFEADETLWRRLESLRYKDGYKDGTVEGGEYALQMGFNLGYKQTIKPLYQVAKMKGIIMNILDLMQDKSMSHQTRSENAALMQELEEDWARYVTHLKNIGKPLVSHSNFPAKPDTSWSDKVEMKPNLAEDDFSHAMDELHCKEEQEMSISTDARGSRFSSDVTSAEINLPSRTLTVDNSGNTAFEETGDNSGSSGFKRAEDIEASSAMTVADKLSDLTLNENKLSEVKATQSTFLEGISVEGVHNPSDIMSILASDLLVHADDLDSMGKSIFKKYLPKLEMLLNKWKAE